ncbi:MAG: molybdopterin-dependent oxidoreductase, partial [Anaerotignaceae bacterium]
KAAKVIDSYLKGAIVPYLKPFVVERKDLTAENFADREKAARQCMSHTSPVERRDNFHEVNNGFTEEEAVKEASRCLECGCHDYFECKLIKFANDMQVKPEKYEGETHNRVVDNSHPFIDRNPDKCILCGLCVRVCDEVMGRTALGLVDRGFDSIVKPALDLPLKETDCISCGQCINLCPTGALGEKLATKKSVPVSTTCTDTMCSFCSVGCKTKVETKGSLIVKSVPQEDGLLCVKGRFGFSELTRGGRLTTPLVRKNGILTPVSFEEASLYVAKKLQSTAVGYGNQAVAVSISDKLTNEEIYITKKYATEILKAGTVFSYGVNRSGAKEVIGFDGSTNKIEELLSTEVIVLVGTDLMKDHAVLGAKVRMAQARGAKLITLSNDCQSQEAKESDIFVKVENTREMEVILKALVEAGGKAEVEFKGEVTPEAKAVAEMIMKAKKVMVVADQYNLKVEGVKAAALISVVSGKIGTPRSGFILVKGGANSQGLMDLGVLPICQAKEKFQDIKALFVVGEDVKELDKKKLDFLAVADIYLTETAQKADVVLPLVTLTESNGTITSCDGVVNEVKAAIPPLSKNNFEVIKGIANAMKTNFNYECECQIAQEIEEGKVAESHVIATKVVPLEGTEMYVQRTRTNAAYESFENFLIREGIDN